MDSDYPGTPQHQALLAAIVAHYREDPRVRAVAVFGSLSRGNWDALSDLDLDVVIADEARIDVPHELSRLVEAVEAGGSGGAVIVSDGQESGDIVFASLMQASIRYHPLATTSPNIVDSLRVLAGSLDQAAIAAAGLANRKPSASAPGALLDRCVRCVVEADVAVQRGQLWGAVEMLHRFRGLVMGLYTQTHGGQRAIGNFANEASPALQSRLGQTLPQFESGSLGAVVERCQDILEQDLGEITAGQLQLSEAQRQILARVRAGQSQRKRS